MFHLLSRMSYNDFGSCESMLHIRYRAKANKQHTLSVNIGNNLLSCVVCVKLNLERQITGIKLHSFHGVFPPPNEQTPAPGYGAGMRDAAQCIAIKLAFRSTLVGTISQTSIDPSSRSVDTLRFTNSPSRALSSSINGRMLGMMGTVWYIRCIFQVLQI